MKLFAGPNALRVIEGCIEQSVCFTRIEKEVNKQLFGDFTISTDCLHTHISHKRPISLYHNSFNPMVEISISQMDQISRCDLYFATNRQTQVFCNIFNILLILGVSSVIKPITFNSSYNMDLSILCISMVILALFPIIPPKNKMSRANGLIYVLMYGAYMGMLFLG